MRTFYLYILASHSRVLYVGVTNDLARRLYEHRSGVIAGFTRRYHVHRLVYYETTGNPAAAIAREKEIKRWRRAKKVQLIEQDNADWQDLLPPDPPDFMPAAPTGEILRAEFLDPYEITQSRLAELLGVAFVRVNQLVNGRRGMTPDTALRLERLFGMEAQFWLNLQLAWDLYHAQHAPEAAAIKKIKRFRAV